jgi:phosphoserine phosphatase RsbU/P
LCRVDESARLPGSKPVTISLLMANLTGPADHEFESLLSVADSAISTLKVEDFLTDLLKRVREVLEADTATVLLLDEESSDLVATAASGLEEEVILGVRVPLGRGFAGRIAQDKQPISLNRIDSTTVTNPILWEKGIQVILGVPMMAADRVLGVMHVGRLDDRPFTDHDTEVLALVAGRAAGATQTLLLAAERAAARLLERSLLPGRLPRCPGLEFAARYLTPEDRTVGGDWYDLFTLPSGDLWAVTGDVAGHGLTAAVIMGRVRSALRAYALVSDSPEAALELTDRKVLHFEMGTMVTVICAVSAPPYRTFRVASAGHLPPILAAPGVAPTVMDIPVGEPLGVTYDIKRTSATVELADGATMMLYTDGLIERRTEPLDESLERLRGFVRPAAPHTVCIDVLRTFVGAQPPSDDVAIVVIRRGPLETTDDSRIAPDWSSESVEHYSEQFPEEPDSVARARHWAADVLAQCELSRLIDTACLLISELATNALRHARSPYEVTIEVDDVQVLVEVMDHSPELPSKAVPARSEFGGKGLLFLDSLASSWGTRLVPDGKIVFFALELLPR